MAPKRGTNKASTPSKKKGGRKNSKQPTQKPAQQRIAVMGPTGKIRFEWRDW
jgi:hypothetical protein